MDVGHIGLSVKGNRLKNPSAKRNLIDNIVENPT